MCFKVRRPGSAVLPFVLGFISLLSFQGIARSVTQERSTTQEAIRQSLYGTCFANADEGWVVGDLGRIFHTRDGGKSWDRQHIDTRKPFFSISCLDNRTAWVTGKGGMIFKTTDGGRSWQQQQSGTEKHLFAVRFVSPLRGTAVGDWGVIVHTENGGETWEIVPLPADFVLPESAIDAGVDAGDVILYATSFADPDHGWLAGEFGTVMQTSDGGRSWRQQSTPIESTLFGIFFADRQRGWAVGIDAMILYTSDGGQTWQEQSSPVAERSFYDVAVKGNQGWIVGSEGTVLTSTDGGESWQMRELPAELSVTWFRNVTLLKASETVKGFFVGYDGIIFSVEQGRMSQLSPK